ncbi:hypothetical protein [Streptomyces sp. NPDC057702]|uniref:hypothetical protein n=1 Tax=unclassified Streptomyces TaxID=2593676 RepID=UPI003696AFEB
MSPSQKLCVAALFAAALAVGTTTTAAADQHPDIAPISAQDNHSDRASAAPLDGHPDSVLR